MQVIIPIVQVILFGLASIMVASKQGTSRRARVDSKESAVIAMVHANRIIEPPSDITSKMSTSRLETFQVIFDEIISEFANVDWTKHSIRLAAILARTMCAMQEDFEELEDEGSVIQNDRGNYMMNPRRTACQGYATMIMQMRRSLALHAMSGGGRQEQGKRKSINKQNQADAPDDDEDLIATPAVG